MSNPHHGKKAGGDPGEMGGRGISPKKSGKNIEREPV